ncbi:MAG: thioredoxin family protein [Bacteroidales bacterium]|nr:thioredoxin family protein [Bacteroidales bacterium]
MKLFSFCVLATALALSTSGCSKKPMEPAVAASDSTATSATAEAVKSMDYATFTQIVGTVANGQVQYTNQAPVVIDFYATWCPPCKQLKPILESVAQAYAGRVAVYKVDVDKETDLANLYGIRSIPTLLYVDAKGKAELVPGFADADQLRSRFEAIATPATSKAMPDTTSSSNAGDIH